MVRLSLLILFSLTSSSSASPTFQPVAPLTGRTMGRKVENGKGLVERSPRGLERRLEWEEEGVVVKSQVGSLRGKVSSSSSSSSVTTFALQTSGGASPPSSSDDKSDKPQQPVVTVCSFLLFYALNIMYNITNKRTLNLLPHPTSVAVLQLLTGSLVYLFTVLVGLNSRPVLPPSKAIASKYLFQASLSHLLGQTLTVLSLSSAAVSFTHIVKSTEPVFSSAALYLYTGKTLPLPVYVSLLPIIAGVGFACVADLSFSLPSLVYAAASNLFFGVRAVTSKLVLNLDAADPTFSLGGPGGTYGVVTLLATLLGLPLMLLSDLPALIADLRSQSEVSSTFRLLLLSGVYHYINNEVMYRCLSAVTPITLAVGNAFKRVFLIVSSVVVFGTQVSRNGWIGSGVACVGVGGYGVVKERCERRGKEGEK